jgi:O-antigen/teichoic acid export membrane protein
VTAVAGIAVLLAGGGLVAAAAVYLGGALLGLAAAELAWRRWTPSPRPRPTRAEAIALLRGGVPIGIAGVLLVVLLRADILMLSFLDSNVAVGLYAAAYRLVEGTHFLPWSFNAAMLPWLARTPGPALVRGYMLGLKLVAALLGPLALTLACFAGPIVELLYGDEFAGAATPLTLLGLTVVLYGLQTLSSTLLIARDAPATVGKLAGIVALQNITCNAVAIPLWGADGAAAVALSSSALMAGLTIWRAGTRAGGLQVGHAFAGPVAAGAVLVAVALILPIRAGALALLAYAAVLLAIELSFHRDDVREYVRALQRR